MPGPEPAHSLERRIQLTAAVTLGSVLAAHLLLETGRDALFLAHVSAERLPFVYLAGALVSLGIVRLAGSAADPTAQARRVAGFQLLAAVSSVFFFWWTSVAAAPWVYYALYVSSGVVTSVIVVSFWLLVAEHFTVIEAKQRFAGIAMGGALGAVAGSGLAAVIAPIVGPSGLLLVAGALFAASAIGPLRLPPPVTEGADLMAPAPAPTVPGQGIRDRLQVIARHPYARRIAMGVALASIAATLGDFVFKSIAAEQVPADELAGWLARVYLGLNLASIVALAVGVRPLISRLGVDRSLVALPAVVALACVGILVGSPLLFAVVLRTGDGTLRHSIHKTASEILYLPMEPGLRNQVKGVIDLVVHNAARALAAVAILGLTMLPGSQIWIVVMLLALSVVWAALVLRLRGAYLDVFRRTLHHGSIETRIELPDLDLDSVGPLLRALSSPDERRVLGAIDLLHDRHQCNLIPPLILYHPSPNVVARAVDIFAATGREELLDFSDHLLDHGYARVRSAIVRALGVLAPDRAQLEGLLTASCPSVRVSATGGLLAQGWIDADLARSEFAEAAMHHEAETRLGVASGAKLAYAPAYFEVLAALAADPEPDVARESVRAMQRSDEPRFTAVLVGLLDQRETRDLVRDALLERGQPALDALSRALEDTETDTEVLRHIPRTLSRFPTRQAVPVLLSALGEVRNGMVRYKILRGLGPLIMERRLQREERELVLSVLHATAERAIALLRWEAALAQPHASVALAREGVGGELLLDLVRDKQELAVGRMLLLVGLLYPEEDLSRIRTGARSARGRRQASGIELLENLVASDLRPLVRGLLSSGTAAARIEIAGERASANALAYQQAVRELARDNSEALRAFAMYHAAELGLELSEADSGDGDEPQSVRFESLRRLSLALVERLPETVARRSLGSAT